MLCFLCTRNNKKKRKKDKVFERMNFKTLISTYIYKRRRRHGKNKCCMTLAVNFDVKSHSLTC